MDGIVKEYDCACFEHEACTANVWEIVELNLYVPLPGSTVKQS